MQRGTEGGLEPSVTGIGGRLRMRLQLWRGSIQDIQKSTLDWQVFDNTSYKSFNDRHSNAPKGSLPG
jgi:hypothetical protein